MNWKIHIIYATQFFNSLIAALRSIFIKNANVLVVMNWWLDLKERAISPPPQK